MGQEIQKENRGKPLTPGQRRIVADEIRAAPHKTDSELLKLVAPKIGRLIDRTTIQRIRKQFLIPSRRSAIAEMPSQLNERDKERLRSLLGRMFVPNLEECGWNSGEVSTGLVVRRCGRGDLHEYRDRYHVSRLWFTGAEEAEVLDLISGHSGANVASWVVRRYHRLAALVARQLDLVRWHDHHFIERTEPDSLVELQGYLDGGLNPGPNARAKRPFKLVSRHPRLAARVDEFVVRVRARLKV